MSVDKSDYEADPTSIIIHINELGGSGNAGFSLLWTQHFGNWEPLQASSPVTGGNQELSDSGSWGGFPLKGK